MLFPFDYKNTFAQYDSDVNMARFIHQAMVRRSVVVKLIEIMKKCGHRAYTHIDVNEVIAKASALPEHYVPPEIVRLLPLDKLHDKIGVHKSATPAPTPASVEEACALLETKNIYAVVNENSCQDGVDRNAQHNAVPQKLMDMFKAIQTPKTIYRQNA